jgi:dienelactone hydrolase
MRGRNYRNRDAVAHTAHGLSEMMRERIRRLSDLGYVAVATDLYGGGEYHSDPQSAGASMMELLNAPNRLRASPSSAYIAAFFATGGALLCL